MAAINFITSNALRNSATRGVFEAVARPRTISLRDLKSNFPADEDLQGSITLLKQADLIGERPAVIQDFSTYYVTANGLNAAQALRQSSVRTELTDVG
jgi:hypothetical protein